MRWGSRAAPSPRGCAGRAPNFGSAWPPSGALRGTSIGKDRAEGMREMSEPLRLREGSATALERALLEAGRSYRSTGSARSKTLAALGVAGSATLLAGTAQAVPFGTVAKMTFGKLLAAISIVGAAAAVPVGYFAWQRHHPANHGGSVPAVIAAKPIEPEPTQVAPALTGRA